MRFLLFLFIFSPAIHTCAQDKQPTPVKCEIILPASPITYSEDTRSFNIGIKITNTSKESIQVTNYAALDFHLKGKKKEPITVLWQGWGIRLRSPANTRSLFPKDSTTFNLVVSITGNKDKVRLHGSVYDGSLWEIPRINASEKYHLAIVLKHHFQPTKTKPGVIGLGSLIKKDILTDLKPIHFKYQPKEK